MKLPDDPPFFSWQDTRFQKAFTRADLIAVLAVVAVLVFLQSSMRASSRSSGRAAVCGLNLFRLTKAWDQYARDHGGALVGNLDGSDVMTLANSNKTWVLGWQDYRGGSPAGANTNGAVLKLSPLMGYLSGDLSVLKCPSDRSLSRGISGAPRLRSVSMNAYVGERGGPFSSGFRQFRTLESIVNPPPSETFVFIEEREDSINDGWFIVGMAGMTPARPEAYTIVDYPASYHDGSCNLSFADGHVETWKWRDARTMPLLRPGGSLTLGMATPNNPDVARLQGAATRPTQGLP